MTTAVVPRRRSKTIRWIIIPVALLLALVIGVLATRKPAEDVVAQSPLLEKRAPEIKATDLSGKTVNLSDYRGKFVLLNFFASWCVPCQQEHPELLKFQNGHKTKSDAVVLAVMFDDTTKAAQDFMSKNGGDWPVLQDSSGQVALDYGVRGPPESYVIDPDGYVRVKYVGGVTADGINTVIGRIAPLASAKASR